MTHFRRVVLSGIGLWTPFGNREQTYQSVAAGESAVRWLELDQTGIRTAGAKLQDRENAILLAYNEALEDARLDVIPKENLGVVIGGSKGDFNAFSKMRLNSPSEGKNNNSQSTPGALPDDSFLWCQVDAPLLKVMQHLGQPLRASCPVAACATGLVALSQAARWIETGDCDIVIAGSCDFSLHPLLIATYRRMGVLARLDEDSPPKFSPFSRTRNGFLVGEGAGVIILEAEDHARARSISPYCRWSAGSLGSDPWDMILISSDSISEVISRTLEFAKLKAAEIDYVNAHGTATIHNDLAEALAINKALANRVPVSSLKGSLGHTLGGAGSIETALTAMSLSRDFLLPTAMLNDPDPALPINHIEMRGRPATIRHALKLSFGFGGHIAAAVLSKIQ